MLIYIFFWFALVWYKNHVQSSCLLAEIPMISMLIPSKSKFCSVKSQFLLGQGLFQHPHFRVSPLLLHTKELRTPRRTTIATRAKPLWWTWQMPDRGFGPRIIQELKHGNVGFHKWASPTWMVESGKSYKNGWFRGNPHLWKPPNDMTWLNTLSMIVSI